MATFFFCGIGGIGMSAIALYLKSSGHTVLGSDRSFDQNKNLAMKNALLNNNIKLFKQDGSGVTADITTFVVSSAIEDSIPDVKKAKDLGLTIKKRAQILADIFHMHPYSIAIAGTSGKTSVTAMVGHILHEMNLKPVMINGGISLNNYNNKENSNLIYEKSDICVIEADESDGSIELYTPYISVVNNISLDHKPLEETRPLFENFLNKAKKGIVINADCPETKKLHLTSPNCIDFSTSGNKEACLCATDILSDDKGISFKLQGQGYHLPFLGLHNLANALTATGVALHLGISATESLQALASFKGTKRRLELIGTTNRIRVFDDYAHNSEKIKAALRTFKNTSKGHLYAFFQPHGFAPLRLMKQELIDMLKEELSDNITFIGGSVFYAGGTVQKDISTFDIIEPLQKAHKSALYYENRQDVIPYLLEHIQPDDTVLIMGARDDSLTTFAQDIFKAIETDFKSSGE